MKKILKLLLKMDPDKFIMAEDLAKLVGVRDYKNQHFTKFYVAHVIQTIIVKLRLAGWVIQGKKGRKGGYRIGFLHSKLVHIVYGKHGKRDPKSLKNGDLEPGKLFDIAMEGIEEKIRKAEEKELANQKCGV